MGEKVDMVPFDVKPLPKILTVSFILEQRHLSSAPLALLFYVAHILRRVRTPLKIVSALSRSTVKSIKPSSRSLKEVVPHQDGFRNPVHKYFRPSNWMIQQSSNELP